MGITLLRNGKPVFGRGRATSGGTVALTQSGNETAAAISGAGPVGKVFSSLKENGPSSPSDIAQDTGLDIFVVKRVIQAMLKQRFVEES